MINKPRENVPWLIKSFSTRTEHKNNSIYYVDQHHRMLFLCSVRVENDFMSQGTFSLGLFIIMQTQNACQFITVMTLTLT
jgi:hypothetical protein